MEQIERFGAAEAEARVKSWLRRDLADVKAAGHEKWMVNRSTHPLFYVSQWPLGYGHQSLKDKARYRLPSVNHNSVLVTVISNDYHPNVWWRLQKMLRHTEQQGMTVAIEELDDPSILSSDAIGIMRACAALLALDSGFEWCFMLDTDALVEEDTLVRLIDRDRPVLYPFLDILHDATPGPVSAPVLYPKRGIQPVFWAAMSAMLFKTKVFNCLDAYSWHGHDIHFAQCLNHWGHQVLVDTDVIVQVTRGPSRHPAKTWEELWAGMKAARDRRQNQDRDRRPPPGFDPAFDEGTVDQDGVYWALDKWKYGGVWGPVTQQQIEAYKAMQNGDQPA